MTTTHTTDTPAPTVRCSIDLIQLEQHADGTLVGCLGHNEREDLDDLNPARLMSLGIAAMAVARYIEGDLPTDTPADEIQPTDTTTAVTIKLPQYVTIARAAEAMQVKPWKVVELVDRGEIQAIQYDRVVLCRVYDVEQLGGVL